jgi:nucleoid DNA-binding protein
MVIRTGALLSIALGLGVATSTGDVAAKSNAELVEAIAAESGLSTADAKTGLDAVITATATALQTDGQATWDRFGSFSISKRSARTGRNRRTDTTPENSVQFTCSAELAAALDLVPGAVHVRRLRSRRRDAAVRSPDPTRIDAALLSREAQLSVETATAFLDAFIATTTTALKRDDRLSLPGFGSFSISKRSARTGRNPQTGKEIRIAARTVVKFKAGAALSNAVT